MRYKSKIDIMFVLTMLIFTAIPIATSILSIYYEILLIPLTVMFLIIDALILFPMWMYTNYIFEDDCLKIISGFFVKIKIPYKDITSYGKAKGELTSTALARNGIKILYNDSDNIQTEVYISPQYTGFFLDEMRKNTGLDAKAFPVPHSFRLSK